MANIAYVLRKNYHGALIPTIKQLSGLMEVLPMTQAQLEKAMLLDGPDFEDILQAVCAQDGGCETLSGGAGRNSETNRSGKCDEGTWNCEENSPNLYRESHT